MGKRLFPIFFTSYTSTFLLFTCHSGSHLVEAGRGRRSRNFITSPLNMIIMIITIMIITTMITTITTIIMILT